MSIAAITAFAMVMSAPPPDYVEPVIEGPTLFCGLSFSLQLNEGESVSIPWGGAAFQVGSVSFFQANTDSGPINIYEDPADKDEPEIEEEMELQGGRFTFLDYEDFEDGSNTHSMIGFRTSDHESVARVVLDFIGAKDEEAEDVVLFGMGRIPLDPNLCETGEELTAESEEEAAIE